MSNQRNPKGLKKIPKALELYNDITLQNNAKKRYRAIIKNHYYNGIVIHTKKAKGVKLFIKLHPAMAQLFIEHCIEFYGADPSTVCHKLIKDELKFHNKWKFGFIKSEAETNGRKKI